MSNDSDIDRSRALIEEIQAGIEKLLSGDLHPKGSTPARHSPDETEVVPHLTVIHKRLVLDIPRPLVVGGGAVGKGPGPRAARG